MKILQINSVCGIRSTGRIATDIHKVLIEKDYESYIAYGRSLPLACKTTIKIGNKFNEYFHYILSVVFDKHGLGSRMATNKFINEIDKINPDIIHLHNIHGYYINIEILFDYLKSINKPIIWTLHDCWAFTGHCAYFDIIGCIRWKSACYNCPQRKSYPVSLLFDNSKNNFRIKKKIFCGLNKMTIVTPSKWLAELVSESFLKEYPIRVINNGIDLENFKQSENSIRHKYKLESKFIILCVASVWSDSKGYSFILDLSKDLKSDEIIIMLGLTEKQKKKLPKQIIGVCKTNNTRELAEIYTAADVFINPTLQDNFPTTNLEALACGTPIITFNTGGSVESINKNCGYVVEKGDKKELLIRINEIKKKTKANYSSHCRNNAIKLYDKEDRFNDYIELYKSYFNLCKGV